MHSASRNRSQVCWVLAVLCIVLASAPYAVADTAADRILVLDGSMVHDVGNLHVNITNWGLIGSRPGIGAAYSEAPSAMWPAGSGVEYLWAGGLWIGAIRNGVPLVSTGQYSAELLADPDDPLDRIWLQHADPAHSRRYPAEPADDDGDGLEDEDPVNGLDDDGDTLVDEDAGAIADQHFRAVLRDDTQLAQDMLPDHAPLGLEIVQESFQWAHPAADDFVGFRCTLRNVGPDLLEDVYVGVFADCDIGPRGQGGIAADDLPYFVTTHREFPDGTVVPVQVAGMYDADGDAGEAPGIFGIQILGHPVDPQGVFAPAQVGMTGFRYYSGNRPYAEGGDPTNDAERYDALATQGFQPVPPFGESASANDYRILATVGPFASLAPGEKLVFDFALVVGEGRGGLVDNAATAGLTKAGRRFDRDGDPETGPGGEEYLVEWLRTPEMPVPVLLGELEGRADGQQASVLARLNMDRSSQVRVRREATDEHAGRTWGAGALDVRYGGARVELGLVDADPVGWPRHYALEVEEGDRWRQLDGLSLRAPLATRLEFTAAPNPFNPRVVLSWVQPRAGEAQLRIYDMRGRLVRDLAPGPRGPGAHEISWDGTDAHGRAVGSGVYLARVVLDGERRQIRLTLVR